MRWLPRQGLRLEVEDRAATVVELLRNPSGALGAVGWTTTAAGSRIEQTYLPSPVRSDALRYVRGGASGSQSWRSELGPVTPGRYVRAAASVLRAGVPTQLTIDFHDDNDAVLASVPVVTFPPQPSGDPATFTGAPVQVPAGAVSASLRFDSTASVTFYRCSLKQAPTADFTADDNPVWVDVLGSATGVTVRRSGLDTATISAMIRDSRLDPSRRDLLQPGQQVRLMCRRGLIYTRFAAGRIVTPVATYEPLRRVARKRVLIEITTADAVADLVQAPRPDGVGTIPELPAVLEGTGVPWNVNGSTAQIPDSSVTIVSRNEAATAIDQVAITRDSRLGYAWMSRDGVLNAWDADLMPAIVVADLSERRYSAIDISWDLATVINEVTLKLLRWNLATGETVEVPYGPFRNESSVRRWGRRTAEFTVHGLEDTAAAMSAFAARIIAANGTARRRINSVTVPVNGPDDVALALVDLYDLVRVTSRDAGLDQTARVIAIEHTITPRRWLITFTFTAEGTVAMPEPVPALSVAASA